MSVVFQAQPGIRWVWLFRYHPELWKFYMDGLLTKYEVYLSIVGKII